MVVAAVAEAAVTGCMMSVMVPEEVDETEEREGAADEIRLQSTVLTYRIRLVILQPMNGPA